MRRHFPTPTADLSEHLTLTKISSQITAHKQRTRLWACNQLDARDLETCNYVRRNSTVLQDLIRLFRNLLSVYNLREDGVHCWVTAPRYLICGRHDPHCDILHNGSRASLHCDLRGTGHFSHCCSAHIYSNDFREPQLRIGLCERTCENSLWRCFTVQINSGIWNVSEFFGGFGNSLRELRMCMMTGVLHLIAEVPLLLRPYENRLLYSHKQVDKMIAEAIKVRLESKLRLRSTAWKPLRRSAVTTKTKQEVYLLLFAYKLPYKETGRLPESGRGTKAAQELFIEVEAPFGSCKVNLEGRRNSFAP
ncbi:hypothetical protein J6590_076999 [Homalodisca vitripennis]|nr:hypothetical protein J6590_076999 [Homalodisca vitripennis]